MEILNEIDMREIAAVTASKRFTLPLDENAVAHAMMVAYDAEVRQRGGTTSEYLGTEKIEKNLNSIAAWLTNGTAKPGLLLYGAVGTGKTTALSALCRVVNACCKAQSDMDRLDTAGAKVIKIVRAKDIVAAYQNDPDLYKRMLNVRLLAIDELGVEAIDVKSYGNSSEPIIDLLSTRYDLQRFTAVSSNLDLKQVSDRYGLRMADRFNEMFHKVAFIGPSFRGYANQKAK